MDTFSASLSWEEDYQEDFENVFSILTRPSSWDDLMDDYDHSENELPTDEYEE